MERRVVPPGTTTAPAGYAPIGPSLFCAIKFVYERFVYSTEPALQEEGLEAGAQPNINIVSTGWHHDLEVLSQRTTAFWFAFNPEDKDEVDSLNDELTTVWEWVQWGYAVVSSTFVVFALLC